MLSTQAGKPPGDDSVRMSVLSVDGRPLTALLACLRIPVIPPHGTIRRRWVPLLQVSQAGFTDG